MSLSGVIENIRLSGDERLVLDIVADYQLTEGQPVPIEHVILSRLQQLAALLKATVMSLVDKDCLELSGLEPRNVLHLTPTGLMLCARTSETTRFAERLLSFFKRRLEKEGVKFHRFTWTELRRDQVAEKDEDWALALVTVQVLDLYSSSASSSPGPPPEAMWGVPDDIVYLRDVTDISGLYDRAEVRRKRRNQMLPMYSGQIRGVPGRDSETSAALSSRWTRLRTAVKGAAAVIEREPKHLTSMKASAERALEILSGAPSATATEELDDVLGHIEKFVARYRPKARPTPGVVYTQPPWARNTDIEIQAALRILRELRASDGPDTAPNVQQGGSKMKIFVSHSSADRDVAGAFVELLRAALPVPAKEIRCTSVDGYKLPAGTLADEQLRREVFESATFVALLSPKSIGSMYVMFELGARWGAGRYLAPIMIAGVDPNLLKAPLSAIHAVNGTSEADLHQLIDTLAEKLGLRPEKPNVYAKALHIFAGAAAKVT